MIKKAFSVRDAKAEIFHPPMFLLTHGEAERSFSQFVRDEKSPGFQFPEDFDLYFIGEFDDQTGKFSAVDTPQHLLKAVQVKAH